MTNKEEDEEPSCVPHMATLLAVHLVSQVLEEAYIIANTAKDTGKPWCYITNLKKVKTNVDDTFEENLTFTVSKGDYIDDSKPENESSVVVTSTPQKVENGKPKNDAILIGQGDEELEIKDSELRKSTSMFINHLFDMSDVEGLISGEDTEITQNNDANYSTFDTVTKIVDAYVNMAFDCANGSESQKEITQEAYMNYESSTSYSTYSLLSDAFILNNEDKAAKFINDIRDNKQQIEVVSDNNIKLDDENKVISEKYVPSVVPGNRNDTSLYENTYLTLNRDYEQYSDEEPVLQDPKGSSLQEIELRTAHTSEENLTSSTFKKNPEKPTTSRVSTSVTGSRKSRLVRRCRVQGERLLACLRGWWWRRKLEGKHKFSDIQISRAHGSVRGLCPLSPDARRRATSLLDQRHLRTPSPPQHVVWKFNTINESLVRSSRWKHFGFKTTYNINED